MPSQTFQIAASGDDSMVDRPSATNEYPPNGALAWFPTRTPSGPYRGFLSGVYYVDNLLLRWDTSTLPDGIAVTGATLRVNTSTVPANVNGLSMTADWAAWDGSSASDFSHEEQTNAIAGIPIANITGNTANVDWPLDNAPAGVNPSGWTYLRLHISRRASDAAPTGNNAVYIVTFDGTPANAARLIVDYEEVARTPHYADALLASSGVAGDFSDEWLT